MSPLHALDEKALFEALAEYYSKYRLAQETHRDRLEINVYLDSLLSIMAELNRRSRLSYKSESPSREFKSKRESEL